MPRDPSGNYTLTAQNPVVTGTVIATQWANPTLNDIADALTASLDRYGRGGMLAPFYLEDGTIGAPGLAFNSEPASGLYRAGTHDLRMSINGVDVTRWSSGSFTVWNGTAWVAPGVRLDVANTWSALQTFSAGITMSGGALTVTSTSNAKFNANVHLQQAASVQSYIRLQGTASDNYIGPSANNGLMSGITDGDMVVVTNTNLHLGWLNGRMDCVGGTVSFSGAISAGNISSNAGNFIAGTTGQATTAFIQFGNNGNVARFYVGINSTDTTFFPPSTACAPVLYTPNEPLWAITPTIVVGLNQEQSFYMRGPAASGYFELRTSGSTTNRGFALGIRDNGGNINSKFRYFESEGSMHLVPPLFFDAYAGTGERTLKVQADGTVIAAVGGGGASLDVAQTWTALQTFQASVVIGNASNPTANSAEVYGTVFRTHVQIHYFLPADTAASNTLVYGSITQQQRIYIGSRNQKIAFGDTRTAVELASSQNPTWWNGTTETPLAAVAAVALVNADGTVVRQRGFASIAHTGPGQYDVTFPDYDGVGTLVALQRGTDGVRVVVAASGATSGTIETWVGAVKTDQPFLVMLLAF